MKWQKMPDRFLLQADKLRYHVRFAGKRWQAYLNPWTCNINEMQWRTFIGVFDESKAAKAACEEHFLAAKAKDEVLTSDR